MPNNTMIPIPGRLHSVASGNNALGANEVIDDELNKKQSVINHDVNQALGEGGSVDERIVAAENQVKTDIIGGATSEGNTLKKVEDRVVPLESAVGSGGTVDERIAVEGAKHYLKSETYTKYEVNGLITTPDQEFVSVYAEAGTTDVEALIHAQDPTNEKKADTIYRVGNWDGTQYDATCYSEYAWSAENLNYVKLSTKNVGVDNVPTAGSDNLVKSGGVYRDLNILTVNTPEDYSTDILELWLSNSPVDKVNFKCYRDRAIFSFIDSEIYAWTLQDVMENNIVYPIKVYAGGTTEYPIGTTVGYVMFKDVASFKTKSNATLWENINRKKCENPANSPLIQLYLGNIEIAKAIESISSFNSTNATNVVDSATPHAGFVKELYMFGSGVDTAKTYRIGGVTRNNPTYKYSIYIEDTERNIVCYLQSYPTTPDNPVLIPEFNNSGISAYAIVNWDEFEDGSNNDTNITLLPRVFDINYSPVIKALLEVAHEVVEVCIPDEIVAVVGDTLQLYYHSIYRCVDYSKYAVKVICDIGAQFPRYYEVTPLAGQIGNHTITFAIKDNNNNLLGTKTSVLKVVAVGGNPQSELNVLCLGASGTNGGQWASEFKRRLVGTGGTPAGSGKSNILFVGRKDVTFEGKQVNLEATGGYSFSTYTSTSTARYRFNVSAENEPVISVGDVYSHNGFNYTIVEINITAGSGGYFSCEGAGTPQSSGTLTKVSGTGSDTIIYSSSSYSGNPFVYNGVIDMQQYADDYCNPQGATHGRIDVVYTELLYNGSTSYMEDFTTRMAQMQAFIVQTRAVFPNCKFCIGLNWNPDVRGGMGVNYGADGSWSDPYGIKYSNMNLCNALQKYITDNNLSDYVFILNWLNEFDTLNDMQQTTKQVNPRSSVTEIFGVNGVHPATVGYNQMADTAWRLFIAKFCQS